VLDASAGLPIILEERPSRMARGLYASWAADGAELIVPALFWIEVANTPVRYLPAQQAVAKALHSLASGPGRGALASDEKDPRKGSVAPLIGT
jgi:hypothetical protein